MKFDLGQVVATNWFRSKFDFDLMIKLINRHVNGDWGDLEMNDWQLNEAALMDGDRILSMYRVNGQKIYVITESDRSYTTIMLSEEY